MDGGHLFYFLYTMLIFFCTHISYDCCDSHLLFFYSIPLIIQFNLLARCLVLIELGSAPAPN